MIPKTLWLCLYTLSAAICIFAAFRPVEAGETALDFLTTTERQWLADHPTLRLGVGVSFPPYQWVSQEDQGKHIFKGVVSDYVKILENRLKVHMDIVYDLTFKQALDLGRKKEIDLFPCLAATPERSQFLLFSKPYISYPSVIITRVDAPFIGKLEDLRGRKISAVKDQVIHTTLLNKYAHLNLSIVETENAEKDLEAVSFGRVDACLMDLGVASYFIEKLRLTNLKVAAPTEIGKIELAMGVREDWPVLQGILEKTMATISAEERDAINQKWIRLQYDPGIPVARIFRWAIVAGTAVAAVLALFFFWNKSLQREISARQKVELERNDLITSLKQALSEVKTLQGFLPICSSCKRIRNDTGYWQQIEHYIEDHTDSKFSHSICPDCINTLYPEMAGKILRKAERGDKPPSKP
ncbi:MAG: transporter substrate-binding domain-containing protein [Desulforhopalus sp.]|nr:transporter substrate-binding domain-containing protein [Desulforhopalus sp.]